MSSRNFKFGQCKSNEGSTIMTVNGIGPMLAIIEQFDDVDFALAFLKKNTGAGVCADHFVLPVPSAIDGTAQEAATATEDSGETGDATTLAFGPFTAANRSATRPLVPGSIHIIASSPAPDLRDKDQDGILYSMDSDLEASGTVNYDTGVITILYGTGKAHPAANIFCNYQIGRWRLTFGNHILTFTGPFNKEPVRVVGFTKGTTGSCRVALEVIFT